MKKISLLIAGIILSGSIYAEKIRMTQYESVKQKSMGGATILSEVNENALVNNPALLNEIDKWELNLFGLSVSISPDTVDTAEGIQSMIDDLDSIGDNNDSDIVDLLTAYLDGTEVEINSVTYNAEHYKLANEKLVLDLTQVIAYAKKNFGVGIFTALTINDLRLINTPAVGPEIKLDISGTVQVPVGFAHAYGDKGQYIVGASVKAIGGVNATAQVDASDLAEDNDDSIPYTAQTYTGMALDLGFIYKTDYLNYALTLNNIYSSLDVTTEENDIETESSGKFPTSLNLAISNKYDKADRMDKWWDKYVFWTLELKNITNSDLNVDGDKDDNLYKKVHFGASSMVFNNKWLKLDLRAGLNQGYPTYGFGTELFSLINIDYAYSTRELGDYIGMKEENLHSLTIDFRM